MSIEDLTPSPGQKQSSHIPIIDRNHTTHIPLSILNGINDGPTLLVLSGIHGAEYIPILTTQKLASELDPSVINGRVILVHIANLPSFLGRTVYTSPIDGKNLNRVFPGKVDGTLTEQIAYKLDEDVYQHADYVIDIHSGDGNEQLSPSYTAYYGKGGADELIHSSRNMAVAFGLDLMVEFQWELQLEDDENNETSSKQAIWAGSAAVVRGIPSIDVELAPGMGKSHSEHDSIDEAYRGVLQVMHLLQMIINPSAMTEAVLDKIEDLPCLVKERYFIDAPLDGSWIPLIEAGTFLSKGTKLGFLTDYSGRNTVFNATAPSDGLVLIRFDSPPVLEGDTLAVMAVLDEEDLICERLKHDGLLLDQQQADSSTKMLVFWQSAAGIGWVVALGLGIFLGKNRRGRNSSYQNAPVSMGEGELITTDARIV